jgi:hypothetical protein
MNSNRRPRTQINRGIRRALAPEVTEGGKERNTTRDIFQETKQVLEQSILSNSTSLIPLEVSCVPSPLTSSTLKTVDEVNDNLIASYSLDNYFDLRKAVKNSMELSSDCLLMLLLHCQEQIKKLSDPKDTTFDQKEYPFEKRLKLASQFAELVTKLTNTERIYAGRATRIIGGDGSLNSSLSDEELSIKEMELASILGKSFTKREIKITETSMGGNGAQS